VPALEREDAAAPPPVAARAAARARGARVSIVIPVLDEEANLAPLYARLRPVMDGVAGGAEAILVDDGSRDRSLEILRGIASRDPRVRVVSFNRNYGQHAAVLAGLERAAGDVVVTLDADIQNPPEEIPKLIAKADEGCDVVAGRRAERKDTLFRRAASRLTNRLMARAIGVDLRDFGCMLRAYRRDVVQGMLACDERSTFIPALACRFARRIAEVEVAHAERAAGSSKYSLRKLLALEADLVTGFSTIPLRILAWAGAAVAALSAATIAALVAVRLLRGSPWDGSWVALGMAALALLGGVELLGLGVLGAYVSRIYDEVRRRPRSIVKETINL